MIQKNDDQLEKFGEDLYKCIPDTTKETPEMLNLKKIQ